MREACGPDYTTLSLGLGLVALRGVRTAAAIDRRTDLRVCPRCARETAVRARACVSVRACVRACVRLCLRVSCVCIRCAPCGRASARLFWQFNHDWYMCYNEIDAPQCFQSGVRRTLQVPITLKGRRIWSLQLARGDVERTADATMQPQR